MRCPMLHSTIMAAVSFTLAACNEMEPETSFMSPPDYSPHYTYIDKISDDGRVKRVLVPEACLSSRESSPADEGPPRLPPGCANNYNLQRMVEKKRDLTQGRPIGPAPAAPAVRAAQRYIDGRDEPVLGGGIRDDESGGSTDASVTP